MQHAVADSSSNAGFWLIMVGRFGRLLFSLAIIGIGVETLICAYAATHSPGLYHGVTPVVPWLPELPSLAYCAGLIFILCGAGLLFQRTLPVSSITLGVLLVLCGLAFDLPRHPNLMSAEWRTNLLEPIVMGSLAWLAWGGIPGWLHRLSHYIVAFALFVFGIAHFQILTPIAHMVPGWIPLHWFWTVFFGVAFFAASMSLATGFLARWAALGVGLMFALWTVTIHLPALLATHDPDKWSDVFIIVALWGGFWALACEARQVRRNRVTSDERSESCAGPDN
jgi:hypothetical protein